MIKAIKVKDFFFDSTHPEIVNLYKGIPIIINSWKKSEKRESLEKWLSEHPEVTEYVEKAEKILNKKS